jgi:hypothetical protein
MVDSAMLRAPLEDGQVRRIDFDLTMWGARLKERSRSFGGGPANLDEAHARVQVLWRGAI